METSIVIPAYNREKFIDKCLQSLFNLEYKNFEVIVVDDGSIDKTLEIARNFQNKLQLKLISLPHNQGVSAARNAGIKVCEGEFIIFIDSDSEVLDNWPKNLLDLIKNTNSDAASGAVEDKPARNQYELASVGTTLVGRGKIQSRILAGGNMIFKSELLKEFQFDEALIGAEEDDMQIRLLAHNKKMACTKLSLVIHDHPLETWHDFITFCKTRGKSAAQLSYKHNKIARDIILLQLSLIFIILAIFNKTSLNIAIICFLLQIAALIFNELAFKNNNIKQTLRALNILIIYHSIKTYFFSVELLEIITGKDKRIIKSKKDWQSQLNLQRKHSSCCSFQ